METSKDLTIKIEYENEIRRIELAEPSFANLKEKMITLMGLKLMEKNYIISYRDDEGDYITMASEEEFQMSIKFVDKGLLRLRLKKKDKPEKPYMEYKKPQYHRERDHHHHHPHHDRDHFHEHREHREHHNHHPRFEEGEHHGFPFVKKFIERKFENKRKKLEAKFLSHVTILPEETIERGSKFIKTWRMKNEGTDQWPEGCKLVFISHKKQNIALVDELPVKALMPGEEIDLSLEMIAPDYPGKYVGYWRMQDHRGKKFGQRIWISIYSK